MIVRTLVRTLCRVVELVIVVVIIFVFDAEFDSDSLSGLIIKIEHGGEILTSFLARSIKTRLLFEA